MLACFHGKKYLAIGSLEVNPSVLIGSFLAGNSPYRHGNGKKKHVSTEAL